MSSILLCRRCNKPITFDDKHISQCPMQPYPYQRPQPQQQQQQQKQSQPEPQKQQQRERERRYQQCRKGCGQEIYFDANSKSQSGKWIPLERTGKPHQCQTQ